MSLPSIKRKAIERAVVDHPVILRASVAGSPPGRGFMIPGIFQSP